MNMHIWEDVGLRSLTLDYGSESSLILYEMYRGSEFAVIKFYNVIYFNLSTTLFLNGDGDFSAGLYLGIVTIEQIESFEYSAPFGKNPYLTSADEKSCNFPIFKIYLEGGEILCEIFAMRCEVECAKPPEIINTPKK